MSHPHETIAVLEAAEKWKERCLLDDGSVLTDRRLWSLRNLEYLDRYFVQNLDTGEGSFWDKLEVQLDPAPPEAKQLAAEMVWLLYIFVSERAMNAGTKRSQIRMVWEWSGEAIPEAEWELGEVLERGVGHPGTAYNTHRWREFRFLILLMERWKRLPEEEQRRLVGDPWAMAAWVDEFEETSGRQFRHVLLYLLFPDHFDPIATSSHKRTIVRAFREEYEEDPDAIRYSNRLSLDREVHRIRERVSEQYGSETLSFYRAPLREVWNPAAPEPGPNGIEEDLDAWYAERFGSHRVWAIGAGRGARDWPEFRRDGVIAIGWDSLGDLRDYHSREEVQAALRQERESDINPTNNALACWQFAHEMQTGDYVIAKKGRGQLLGWGVVTSDYRFDVERAEFQHVRDVEWRATGSWDLPEERRITNKTLTDFTPYKDWLRVVFPLMESGDESGTGREEPEEYTKSDALDDLFLSPEEFTRILDTLGRKRNVILEGPPGVGKTFIARRIAWALFGAKDPERVEMVQFHQSYAYEDFVQGWRPNEQGGFELRDGVFHRFCQRAQRDRERPYVFIIDEINRGNLSKILGELMMLIEGDKRGPKHAIQLTYSGPEDPRFYIPDNLYVLGMMNTADRSLAMVDYALRRRFGFVRLDPAFRSERFTEHLIKAGVPEALVTHITSRMTELNRTIREDTRSLGPGFEIGHSYFVPQDDDAELDQGWYDAIIQAEIEPLLHEYWFDQPERVEALVSDLRR